MIETRVARIVSPTQVVLTAGARDGVEEGMEFVIYELTDPILDPETQESLGKLEMVKGRVRVVHVQETVSIAQTIPKKVTRSGSLAILGELYGERTETVFPKLPVKDDEIRPLLAEVQVRVGDLVHSVSTPASTLQLSG